MPKEILLPVLYERSKAKKMNLSVMEGYQINNNAGIKLPKAIFGGIVINQIGHVVTETLSRLWYVVENESSLPIIFIKTEEIVPSYFWSFISFLGIDHSRIVFADTIIHVDEIIIPEQSLVLHSSVHKNKFKIIYNKIKSNIINDEQKTKLYLTRTQLNNKDCIGEEYFENFYKALGYKIVAPEQLPIEKQIQLINSASSIVCTGGTLSHLAVLFGNEDVKLTILLRKNFPPALIPQIILNQAMGISYTIVDVSMSLLPDSHTCSIFLLGPSFSWKQFMQSIKIDITT